MARMVKEWFTSPDVVPLSTPVEAFSASPLGSVPLVTE
jgi:hypothetical protein